MGARLASVIEEVERQVEELGKRPKIPNALIEAVVAAEDRRFFSHNGVDPRAMARALWAYIRTGRLTGASTLEQQLVRTIRGRYEPTLARKITEINIAMKVSKRFSKRQLVEVYCHIAYLGWRAQGMSQAARRLGVDLSSLSLRESATLASMLKLPMPRFPSEGYARRLQRRTEYVLHVLSSNGRDL